LANSRQNPVNHKSHLARYRQIGVVLSRYRLGEVLRYVGLQKYAPLLWLLGGNPWRKMTTSKPERTALAIEELGTSFIKLGQILSTRSDILPPEYIKELSKLQNALKPLPLDVMQKVMSDELGQAAQDIFSSFTNPLGSASIGQVYTCGQIFTCSLPGGMDVVLKVQKPGVREQIDEDMLILSKAAIAANKHWRGAQQYDLVGIVEELTDIIHTETDYIHEGRNAEYLGEFFKDDQSVHIPKVIWEYTTERIITLERVHGICIRDVEELDKAGFNRKDLARRAVGLWLKMIFEGEAFHADPHPGNLFVEPDGHLGLVDFGMVAPVDDEVRWNLANTLKAILDRNVDRLIDSLIELGAVNLGSEITRASLRKDMKYVMRRLPSSRKQAAAENLNSNLGLLFTILRRNHIQLPANTFMLLKTIIMAQGLGKNLDPEFDLLPILESHIQHLVRRRYSISSALRKLPGSAAELATLFAGLPQRLDRILKTAERGEIQVRADVSGVEKHIHHLEILVNRTLLVLVVVAVFLGLTLLFVGWRLRQ
jgi:ubiquinone biosynthesis protein